MNYPLDEPHLAALRWAATFLWADPEAAGEWLAKDNNPAHATLNDALRALSATFSAAQLVRDLLGACGADAWRVDTPDDWHHIVGQHDEYFVAVERDAVVVDGSVKSIERIEYAAVQIAALILALLDALALPEGRKEAALKALREAGR